MGKSKKESLETREEKKEEKMDVEKKEDAKQSSTVHKSESTDKCLESPN